MAEAMSTLTGRVYELQQQMADVQQEKLNSSWTNLEALTQVGAGKNHFNSPGTQPCVLPARPVASEVPITLEALWTDAVTMRCEADRQADLQKNFAH